MITTLFIVNIAARSYNMSHKTGMQNTSLKVPLWLRILLPFEPVVATLYNSFVWHFRKRNRFIRKGDLTLITSIELPHPRYDCCCRQLLSMLETIHIQSKRVLDVNTGSGCFAVVAASKGAEVAALDERSLAASVLTRNSEMNGLMDSIQIMQGDLTEMKKDIGRFDLITCQSRPGEQLFDFHVLFPSARRRLKTDGTLLLPLHWKHYSKNTLKAATESGLQCVQVDRKFFHCILTFQVFRDA
ncbi:MAG: methyltransferase domain-containing protein [Calditrichaeota bacterium]|nr:MAG: methyltransferase domain-containing protein [Calditrichota bacterium]